MLRDSDGKRKFGFPDIRVFTERFAMAIMFIFDLFQLSLFLVRVKAADS